MSAPQPKMIDHCQRYAKLLTDTLGGCDWAPVSKLSAALGECRDSGKQLFICGNGGSAANAIHLANDFIYGAAANGGRPLRAVALPANSSILTCLANDLSYDKIFSQQLEALGSEGDLLLVLSGSGNSPNVIRALESARTKNLKSFAILGFSGGKCLELADVPIHIAVDDMQVAEDLQMVIGHILMKWLANGS